MVFDRDKLKYSSSEHLECYRQIQIARGMDPTYAVPSANRSDGSINSIGSSSSNSSGSSSSLSAVGTDTSNKTPVATIVDGYSDKGNDGDDDKDGGNDKGHDGDDDKDDGDGNDDCGNDYGVDGNEGNDSSGNKDSVNGNDASNDVILDCAAGTQCKAPSGANLADLPHSCWVCNKKIHSSVLCGDSILNLLFNNQFFWACC